jgi:hypothetical protein
LNILVTVLSKQNTTASIVVFHNAWLSRASLTEPIVSLSTMYLDHTGSFPMDKAHNSSKKLKDMMWKWKPIIEHKGLEQWSIAGHGPEIVVGETSDKLNKKKGTYN